MTSQFTGFTDEDVELSSIVPKIRKFLLESCTQEELAYISDGGLLLYNEFVAFPLLTSRDLLQGVGRNSNRYD